MSLDPQTVTLEQLEKRDLLSLPAQIVARYARAVVVETDLGSYSGARFTVYALADVDTGPYEKPVSFGGLYKETAHETARNWTRLA